MIRSDAEYHDARNTIARIRQNIDDAREELAAEGLTHQQIEEEVNPLEIICAQLREKVEGYDRARAGQFETLTSLNHVGRLLIAARIASGLSQRALAERLGVSEPAVSRDERNDYHGITLDRAQRILDALGVGLELSAKRPIAPSAAIPGPARKRQQPLRAAS